MRPNFVWTTLLGACLRQRGNRRMPPQPPVCWGLPLPHQPNTYIGLSAHYSFMPEHIPMQCPCCGAAALIRERRNIEANGVVVPAVTTDFCPACGEGVLDRIEGDRYARLLAEGHRSR